MVQQNLEQLRRSIGIMKKDIRIYYLKGPVIIFGVLIPLFLFLAFLTGSRNLPPAFLVAGLISMTILFTGTSVSPVIMPWEAQMNTLERLASCPISISTLLMGDMLASFIFGVGVTAVPVIIGLVIGVGIIHPIILTLGIILAAVCFSFLGLLMSTFPTNTPANVMMLSSLVKFPLIFISGIFIPLENMPYWGKIIASFSPLTYFTDLARYSLQGTHYYSISVDFIVIFIFTAVFFYLAVLLHKKTLPQRI
jgi:ABC-2 type transport system permease protein